MSLSVTPVLDHGMVQLRGVLGGDHSVVGAARVSTKHGPDTASKGEESDAKLIRYLMTHGHGTPFEHCVFQWYVKAPIFVVREWQRHRMASFNEMSGRYAEFEPEFYMPQLPRVPDPGNKQSSVVPDDPNNILRDNVWAAFEHVYAAAWEEYQDMLHKGGVAREMARMVLPLNLYTSFWFTVNARSLMNFLMLRNAPDAQWEIREYARALEAHFEQLMPLTHAAFLRAERRAP
jgi:thymidylate synthase (FAD)